MTPETNNDLADIVRTAHEWRAVIDGPDATEADRQAFDAWLAADPRHGDMYDRAQTFWSALGELSGEDFDARLHRRSWRERWAQFNGRVSAFFEPTAMRFAAGAIAAAAICVVFTVAVLAPASPDRVYGETVNARYETGLGETRTVTLSDGTMVTLGAASEITTTYSSSSRKAELIKGVAFFDVASDADRPFLVDAAEMTVTVAGTAFDVRRIDDAVRVAVAEGDVEVSYPFIIDDKPTSLISRRSMTAGQQIAASHQDGMQSIKPVTVSAIGAWRDDRLVYDGDPLAALVADANRYSARRVVIEGDVERISALRIRGAFSARDIDGMLSTLSDIHPLDIDRTDPAVIRIRAAAQH